MTMKDLKKDLMALQIINDFEIFCPNRACNWKGALSSVQSHTSSNCQFKTDKMPEWYKDYLQTQEGDFEKEEMEAEALSP